MSDYRQLKAEVRAAGLLDPQHGYYTRKILLTGAAAAAIVAFALMAGPGWPIIVAGIALGLVSTQLGLIGHDLGHLQITRRKRVIRFGGLLVSGAIAISDTWWTAKHNRHHATPNHVDQDPDLDIFILALLPGQIRQRGAFLRKIIRFQAVYLLVLLPFQSVGVRWASVAHLLTERPRWAVAQGAALLLHLLFYVVLLMNAPSVGWAIVLVLTHQATFGVYNALIFAPNHKGMLEITDDTRLDFLHEQVLTARNLPPHPLTDLIYGGLNYQIEHHLFPTMPRNRLRDARHIIRPFCERHGISYEETGFLRSWREILGHFARVGKAATQPLPPG
jgi:fatty acid desaturase